MVDSKTAPFIYMVLHNLITELELFNQNCCLTVHFIQDKLISGEV